MAAYLDISAALRRFTPILALHMLNLSTLSYSVFDIATDDMYLAISIDADN